MPEVLCSYTGYDADDHSADVDDFRTPALSLLEQDAEHLTQRVAWSPRAQSLLLVISNFGLRLDVFYLAISAICVLFVSTYHCRPTYFLRYSMILVAFIRIPTVAWRSFLCIFLARLQVILASRILTVVLCNALALAPRQQRACGEGLHMPIDSVAG